MNPIRYSLPISTLGLLLSTAAFGGRPDCPTDPVASSCASVCNYDAFSRVWECRLDDYTGWGTAPQATGVIVSNYDVGWDYSAWGTTSAGVNFKCRINSTTAQPIEQIKLIGDDGPDHLCFQNEPEGGTGTHSLYPAGTTPPFLIAQIWGGDQEDEILGSDYSLAGYQDQLFGESHQDDIFGDYGDDLIDGGEHGDNICAEGDNDTVLGGPDGYGDYIYAGAGDDTVYGGDGGDTIFGESGDDTLFGEDGDDQICGQGGVNDLYGESGDDDMHGGAFGSGSSNDGGPGNDNCVNPSGTNCEGSVPPPVCSAAYVTCPW